MIPRADVGWMAMAGTRSYESPDGALRLLAIKSDDGDLTVGFEGYPWHTHGDVLVGEYALRDRRNLAPAEAFDRFISEILEDQAIIAVEGSGTGATDVWITSDPISEVAHTPPDASIEFRYWSGKVWSGQPRDGIEIASSRPI